MNKRPIDNLFSYGEVSTGFGTIEAELNLSFFGIHKKDQRRMSPAHRASGRWKFMQFLRP